jgi:hypothetical protein
VAAMKTPAEAMAMETVCMSTILDTQKTRLGEISIKDYIICELNKDYDENPV